MTTTSPLNRHHEHYRYAREGTRLLKTSIQPVKISERRKQVRYLPGLEIRTTTTSERQTVNLRVVTVNDVRILNWRQGRPQGIPNNQVRFSVPDRAGSGQYELDSGGNLISRELYYPFGGTALWATRNQTEARYKTVRYSGKERDVTGLLYYGYRYYAPWLMRWLNPDPAGTADGLNLYRMVRNNPLTYKDSDGLQPEAAVQESVNHHFLQVIKPAILAKKDQDKEIALHKIANHWRLEGQALGEMLNLIESRISDAKATNNFFADTISEWSENHLLNHYERVALLYKKNITEDMKSYKNIFEHTALNTGSHFPDDLKMKFEQQPWTGSRLRYGALAFTELGGGADSYGDSAFYFTDEVKKNMTFTSGDSLNITNKYRNNTEKVAKHLAVEGNIFPVVSFLNDTQLDKLSGAISECLNPYIEWQYYGRLSFKENLNYISVGENGRQYQQDLLNFLSRHEISVSLR